MGCPNNSAKKMLLLSLCGLLGLFCDTMILFNNLHKDSKRSSHKRLPYDFFPRLFNYYLISKKIMALFSWVPIFVV